MDRQRLIQAGDVSGGLRYAADLLDALPVEHHNRLLHEVARQVLAVVPAGERGRPALAELQARIPERA